MDRGNPNFNLQQSPSFQYQAPSAEQTVSSPPPAPQNDFSDVPPPRSRREPNPFRNSVYDSTIAPLGDSQWRVGKPSPSDSAAKKAFYSFSSSESASARTARRLRRKGQFFSWPLYALPPSPTVLDFSKLNDMRSGAISEQSFTRASYFSELLGAGAFARNYDFYIQAVASAVLDLTNYGPYAGTMRTRYWNSYASRVSNFRQSRPVREAGGDAGSPSITDDLNLFWRLKSAGPNGSHRLSSQILRSLAKQILKAQIDRNVLVHKAATPTSEAVLSISPEYWLASKPAQTRTTLLDKTPYGSISVTLDGNSQPVSIPLIRALNLLSGAAWLNQKPTTQTANIIREYTDYYRSAGGNPSRPFQFEVADWGTAQNIPYALLDIVYFYGYWSYIKARSFDTSYWRSAFEEEVLHPFSCQLPRQRFYNGFRQELMNGSRLTGSTIDQWTQEFENYCSSIGLPVVESDRRPSAETVTSSTSSEGTSYGALLAQFGSKAPDASGGNLFSGSSLFGSGGSLLGSGGSLLGSGDSLFGSGGSLLGSGSSLLGGDTGAGVGIDPDFGGDTGAGAGIDPDFGVEPESSETDGGSSEKDDQDQALTLPIEEKKALSPAAIAGIAAGSVAAAAGLIYLLRR